MVRAASVSAVAFAALFTLPVAAGAVGFTFQTSFDVAALGASGGGTPRGIAVGGGSLYVSDSLDDQIFRIDPNTFASTGTFETDPFACALGATCIPTQEWSRVNWDVAWDGSGLWLVDKESIGGSTTWLIELNANGEFVERFDADVSGADPGGLTYDPRTGGLLVTDRGADWVTHFDLAGNATGISSLLPGSGGSGNPSGIAHFGGDVFLVSDPSDDTVYEFAIPAGGGAATLLGESLFPGFDFAALITDVQSLDYDATTETLYVLDGATDSVYVFTLVPEPGTGGLLALGLAGLAARRRLQAGA